MKRSKPALLPAFLPLIVSVVAVGSFMLGLYKGRGGDEVQNAARSAQSSLARLVEALEKSDSSTERGARSH